MTEFIKKNTRLFVMENDKYGDKSFSLSYCDLHDNEGLRVMTEQFAKPLASLTPMTYYFNDYEQYFKAGFLKSALGRLIAKVK